MLPRPGGSEEKKPARVYTNEDLERVAPFRDQTGVTSTPAAPPAGATKEGRSSDLGRDGARAGKERRSAEEYWRREAQKLRDRLQRPRDQVEELRLKIEQRRRQPGVPPYSDPSVRTYQRRLEVLEQRIRDAEAALEDRARRQGAMPGWLR
jgi:predicted RNase H-like nuclease (RuvC/YqgF family)